MFDKEIRDLRERLDSMISSEGYSYSDILKVSQELDALIVEFLVEHHGLARIK